MMNRAPYLVIGVGNLLYGDEGLGVEAANLMASLPLPDTVEIIDAGTVGFELASFLEHRKKVVVVDAIEAGSPPGTIFRLSPEQLQSHTDRRLSLHQVHILDALAETRLLGTAPDEVVFLAVQPKEITLRLGLSDAIKQALKRVVAIARHELSQSHNATTNPNQSAMWKNPMEERSHYECFT